jgi:hypothetical protein
VDLVEHLTARPGQTQEGRPPEGLARGFVEVEGRSARELYEYARRLARRVKYTYAEGGALKDDLDWAPFFPAALPADRAGGTPPHLALLAAFLKLHRVPRAAMNGFTARHLDFFHRQVLGFEPRPARPDRAHLLVELKKNAQPVKVLPEHRFSAGKDAAGVELLYGPLAETVVNHAKVEELHSVYLDPAGGGTVRFAPEADSADGLGGAFEDAEPKWRAFGHAALPPAPAGFALASPVLRMAEGTRKVTLELDLDGLDAGLAAALDQRLDAFATAPKGWLGPYDVGASFAGERLTLDFTVPATDAAVADYDAAKHAHAFATRLPVVQLLLRGDAAQRYADLRRLVVRTARVTVEVDGVKSLQLESDAGLLDPRRAFQPFGPQPMPGARFMIGFPEALEKKLEKLSVELRWVGLPSSFSQRYAGYDTPLPSAADFNGLFQGSATTLDLLAAAAEPPSPPAASRHLRALALGGSRWLADALKRERHRRPVLAVHLGAPLQRPGFVTIRLEGDLRHAEYRAKLLSRNAPANEPYTPTLSSVTLSYKASSQRAQIDAPDDAAFSDADVELFHVGAFGQRREHAWLRQQLAFVGAKRVPLFPEYEDEGELLIGLSSLAAGDSVALLFQAAEGSADPTVDPQPQVRWSVLCDNYWKPLAGMDAVRDGTNNLLATGIVNVTLPPEASTLNTFLPAGRLWIRASIREHVHGVCQLLGVAANAVEVERRAGGGTTVPAGRIARLKTPIAAVKGVKQPFASFGGKAAESAAAMATRVAERLRHRNRAITAWDYERIVLEAFPSLRKVKCIPHCAGAGGYLDPGHVTLVVVPDLRNRSAVDPLQPRADADTLSRVRAHLEAIAPMRIGIHARNPRYERVRLDFKVRFRAGLEFNFHARQLQAALIAHLSPWAQDPGRAIPFGGAVYRSAVLDFVEDLPYVDYLTDFRMYHLRGVPEDAQDVAEARAATPDTILVSAAAHDIAPAP